MSQRRIRALFQHAPAYAVGDVRADLWNSDVTSGSYGEEDFRYRMAVLEQYRIYIEMADRVSARRGLTNTFFLTGNTVLLSLFGVYFDGRNQASTWLFVLPLFVLLAQCAAWHFLIRSYRQLNAAKYVVVGALEEQLPASPYWRAEWTALGQGRDPARYLPFTHVEQWVPGLFALSYLSGFVILIASG